MKIPLALRIALGVALSFGIRLHAQDGARFEVASVKKASECSFEHTLGPGQVVLGLPLSPIFIAAFKVSRDQIIGPSWLESDCFQIAAKLPEGSTPDQNPGDASRSVGRTESRPSTIFALVVDKGGPKLKEAAENSTFMGKAPRTAIAFGFGGGSIKGIMTMELLTKHLSRQGYGQILDATGLKGEYEISLSWAPDRGTAAPPDAASNPAPDLFTAVRESLGLRLEARKGTTEVLVIDHIERVPTGN
jgi:uncharacterized protein (TIGR03435 family)